MLKMAVPASGNAQLPYRLAAASTGWQMRMYGLHSSSAAARASASADSCALSTASLRTSRTCCRHTSSVPSTRPRHACRRGAGTAGSSRTLTHTVRWAASITCTASGRHKHAPQHHTTVCLASSPRPRPLPPPTSRVHATAAHLSAGPSSPAAASKCCLVPRQAVPTAWHSSLCAASTTWPWAGWVATNCWHTAGGWKVAR